MNNTVTKSDKESFRKDAGIIKKGDKITNKENTSCKTDEESTNNDDDNTKNDDENTQKDDENTEMDDVSTEGDDGVYAPDGGWGWMVAVAGFMVAFIQDGLVTSFGLLLPELLDTFGASVALTSLPPGIMVATFLISGPMTAYLVRRWGCRLVGFCGGLLAALGVAASAYAPSIHLFILGFGLVAGIGIGLIYLPSITMVNVYFHKKRGMAAGIVTSGSGFGLLALAPLTEILMEEYGWRGCYLIMAAITLHFCVCASLMRPLHRPPSSSTHTAKRKDRQRQDSLSLVSIQEIRDTAESAHLTLTTDLHGENQDEHFLHENLHFENGHVSQLELKNPPKKSECSHVAHQETHHVNVFSGVKNMFLSHHEISRSHVPMSSDGYTDPRQSSLFRSRSHGHLESRHSSHRPHKYLHVNALSTWLACQVPPSLSRHSLRSHQSSDIMACQHDVLDSRQKIYNVAGSSLIGSVRQRHHHHHYHHHHHSDSRTGWGHSLPSVHVVDDSLNHVVDTSHQKDSGTPPLHKKASSEDTDDDNRPSTSLIQPDREAWQPTTSLEHTSSGPIQWLKGKLGFISFLLGAHLIQLICYVPPLLTPSYAYQHGVSKEQVATILSIYGVLNTAGRLLAGLLVYCGVRSLHVHNVGTLLSAVACFIFPLSTSFPTIAITLGLHGFFLGAFPPLQSVILVEYLGLDRLASTFGIMCLVKAFGSIAGAPLAGLLFTVTGTYTVPVAVCGAVLVLAAIFHQLMDCCPSP